MIRELPILSSVSGTTVYGTGGNADPVHHEVVDWVAQNGGRMAGSLVIFSRDEDILAVQFRMTFVE